MSQSDAGTGSVDARLLVLLLVLVGSAAWLAQFLSSTPLVGYDDANIFLVYARNIAGGHGFVYNVGGERVEGFTSPAWVLLCAAAMKITTRPEPVLAGHQRHGDRRGGIHARALPERFLYPVCRTRSPRSGGHGSPADPDRRARAGLHRMDDRLADGFRLVVRQRSSLCYLHPSNLPC